MIMTDLYGFVRRNKEKMTNKELLKQYKDIKNVVYLLEEEIKLREGVKNVS